jgi:very-short-patch-repair endonuclease
LLAHLRRRRLPIPEMDARIGRLSVDAYFAELALAVELDHDQTHGTQYAADRDAWRDRYLSARGIETLRIGEDDFAILAAELERRRATA